LLKQYDEICGTNKAEHLGNEYLKLAKIVASAPADADEDSRTTVSNLEVALFPGRAGSKTLERTASVDELFKELNELVGLSRVKTDVTQLANYIKVQQLRKQQGLRTSDLSLHMVFYGNPGTGKTTVARLIASLYRALGVLSKGQFVETDRSGLVAGYVGQTALKVKESVQRALGGVLFVDEAYALKPATGGNDFGDEAIETLLKLMEDHRDDLVVIVAGYTGPMERFLEANPGLKSRFSKYLVFEDYSPAQLIEIFHRFCSQSDYSLSAEAEANLATVFQDAYAKRDETFGNARFARNVFERAIANLASRIVALEQPDRVTLQLLVADDIQSPDIMVVPEKKLGFVRG
jgi:stage V sporulation protein K